MNRTGTTNFAKHLYIHIPFCHKACHYCDFHFSTTFNRYRGQMIAAMRKELASRIHELTTLDTLYFGGGTPSLLKPEELEVLFNEVPDFVPLAECTLEANPEDINKDKLRAWKALGINRLSIGVQNFRDRDLRIMNRVHTAADAEKALDLAAGSGINKLSADLIFAIPGMKLKDWQEQVKHMLDFPISHLSVYALTVEPDTVFGRRRTAFNFPNDREAARQYMWVMDYLEEKGFVQYELSNFCKSGCESRHNSAYWKNRPYAGIGPGAHSYNGVKRRWNISNNARFIQCLESGEDYFEEEILSEKDFYNEWVMCGLRCREGCELTQLQSFSQPFVRHFKNNISKLEEQGLLLEQDASICLTKKGRLQADHVNRTLFITESELS